MALKMLFFIVHGLSVARRQLMFGHWDLHGGNIMFSPLLQPTDVVLQIGEQEHVSITTHFMPKIIDFDTATVFVPGDELSNTAAVAFDAPPDILRLRATFDIAIVEQKFTLDAILRLPHFQSIYKTVEEHVEDVGEKCSMCPRPATQMWEGTTWKFCQGSCAYVHQTINRFV